MGSESLKDCQLILANLSSGPDASDLSDLVRAAGGEIVQCPSHHDASDELLGLGGCIALLRWKIDS